MNTKCGPSEKGEEYCACGCAAYEPDYCGRADCPHSAVCRELGEQNERHKKMWSLNPRAIKTNGSFVIPGRGQVFTADRRQHDFELLDILDYTVLIDNEKYKVTGIESMGRMGPMVGLLVKPIK